ncbi:serine hydrolase FSH [Hypoxylon rubiginosum]|uniref:Serine hydrolase FSH n=1 Tax=Hypoxylon rubiginosum TaxID=110542 RepID=A0ACB9YKN2_9PEZI|nr:serine hydrolase FSH [Hypoxylon rubiginosum]
MDQLPAILCLHGAGTNGTIFALQARSIVQALNKHFRFIFVNAPFESRPGPGVVPIYVKMEPYLWWHCDESAAEQFDIDTCEVQRRRKQVRELLRSTLETENVVGLMAFSQGARVAVGLCLDDELGSRIRFALLISATFPALPIQEQMISEPVVSIPSVHVRGSSDPWAAEGEKLRTTYFDKDRATLVRFTGGHTVPVAQLEVRRVVAAVKRAWDSTTSQKRITDELVPMP